MLSSLTAMALGRRLLLFSFTAQVLIVRCRAQDRAFQWKFGGNYVLTEVQECQNMSIIVESITSNASAIGMPPYYLIAFEPGGVPTTSLVGSDPSHLSWRVNHKSGSALMLTMVDSNGSTGGVPSTLFNVTASSNTSCLPAAPSDSIARISPNVTSTLTTCEPWGLTITNGTRPYNVIFSALNSPVITNVTMGPEDDVFTYIDRADPNGELLAAVVDANGQWGFATSVVRTSGSSNTDCVGLVSSSQTQAQIASEAAARAHAAALAAKHRRTRIIAGVVIGVVLSVLIGSAAWWCWRRKKAMASGIWDGQDTTARAWDGHDTTPRTRDVEIPSMGEFVATRNASRHVKLASTDSVTASGRLPLLSATPDIEQPQSGSSARAAVDSTPSAASPDYSPQSMPLRQNRKADIPHRSSDSSNTPQLPLLHFPQLAVPALGVASPHPGVDRSHSSLNLGLSLIDPDVQPDIIIQHRDGGVVHELPPPYLDRYGPGPAEQT
ncbi:hypothetical protein AcW1_003046 [Taiwanofungus camphoratus]|nr:hypothetical protein AcW1_003046 [Antrodia cinnamomea]